MWSLAVAGAAKATRSLTGVAVCRLDEGTTAVKQRAGTGAWQSAAGAGTAFRMRTLGGWTASATGAFAGAGTAFSARPLVAGTGTAFRVRDLTGTCTGRADAEGTTAVAHRTGAAQPAGTTVAMRT